jgi:hypothetical protein
VLQISPGWAPPLFSRILLLFSLFGFQVSYFYGNNYFICSISLSYMSHLIFFNIFLPNILITNFIPFLNQIN